MAPIQQPTFPQITSFLDLIKSQNLSSEQFQKSLENGDLFNQMFNCPDLSEIDKVTFASLLKPKLTILWTPKDQFVSKVMDRSNLRGWGFTPADAKKLAKKILKHNHLGDLQPTSVSMWLGGDLKFNYSELLLWIKEAVEALPGGFKFKEYSDYVNRLSFLAGSEISGEKFLDVCDLDLQVYWDKVDGIVFKDIKSRCKMWPSLEILVLLALNPQVYIIMDGETVPYIIAAGFVFDSGNLLVFYYDDSEAFVFAYWDVPRWCYFAFVAFRKC